MIKLKKTNLRPFYKFVMPTSNNLKSGEKGVENFEKLYVFIHKGKKRLTNPLLQIVT